MLTMTRVIIYVQLLIGPNSTSSYNTDFGKSSESVQCAVLKACDACADMGQL